MKPLARRFSIGLDYGTNTGRVIIERFAELAPVAMPAVLVAGHAPFTWAASPVPIRSHE